jgi:PTH1 family peptidyl-tRNA hydrolase
MCDILKEDMKLIFAQGNPGTQYTATRHNVGFLLIDQLAKEWGATFNPKPKLKADIAEASVNGEKVLLVKPTTFYNETGQTARLLLDFYKLTSKDFLIIHDDLALPLGTIRTRLGGSDGGNNGLKSLAAHIGTDTARIRVGVWVEYHHGADKVGIVLGKFNHDEQKELASELPTVQRITQDFIADKFEVTTHKSQKGE